MAVLLGKIEDCIFEGLELHFRDFRVSWVFLSVFILRSVIGLEPIEVFRGCYCSLI